MKNKVACILKTRSEAKVCFDDGSHVKLKQNQLDAITEYLYLKLTERLFELGGKLVEKFVTYAESLENHPQSHCQIGDHAMDSPPMMHASSDGTVVWGCGACIKRLRRYG